MHSLLQIACLVLAFIAVCWGVSKLPFPPAMAWVTNVIYVLLCLVVAAVLWHLGGLPGLGSLLR